ncbi:MAG: aspartate carbamoyltransferase catalytic subunit [Oscillospiraceae bacterium]|nr:aspartate carbamoyltransferase catalytic subunit [Oscillospiraceae bacterium]
MLNGKKDLLGIKELTAEEIALILDLAGDMKKVVLSDDKKLGTLKGLSVVTLFYENSTRTRLSFELASKYMSASSANITASGSSVQKGESLLDTGHTIDRMGTDIIIMRHQCSGAAHFLAKNIKAGVINAGDGMNEHPTQALLDALTIKEHKGGFKGLRVAIVGDVLHSRVARSNLYLLNKMGASVILAGPSTLMPKGIETLGAEVTNDVDKAVSGADVIINLRIQLERQKSALFPTVREYSSRFGLNERRLALAAKDALVMHPGPVNRGVEMNSAVIDCDQSFIDEQVTNGVSVRMAILDLLTRGKQSAAD